MMNTSTNILIEEKANITWLESHIRGCYTKERIQNTPVFLVQLDRNVCQFDLPYCWFCHRHIQGMPLIIVGIHLLSWSWKCMSFLCHASPAIYDKIKY